MIQVFYAAAFVAIVATIMAITRLNAVHALLYLVVSLLGVAVSFFAIGAPFLAILEVIIYAGAIMVLFLFVVMMLNLGRESTRRESRLLSPGMWIGPAFLSAALLTELVYLGSRSATVHSSGRNISPQEVGASLFGPYLLGVELSSMILLAGLVAAYHLGRRKEKE